MRADEFGSASKWLDRLLFCAKYHTKLVLLAFNDSNDGGSNSAAAYGPIATFCLRDAVVVALTIPAAAPWHPTPRPALLC